MSSESTDSSVAARLAGYARRLAAQVLSRPDVLTLAAALLLTVAAKVSFLRQQTLVEPIAACLESIWPDLVFFSSAALIFELMHLALSHAWASRCTLLLAACALVWSLLNAIWLVGTSIQLQPGVLVMLWQSFADFWPLFEEQLWEKPHRAPALAAALGIGGLALLYGLARPARRRSRRHHAFRAAAAAAALLAASAAYRIDRRQSSRVFATEVVRFSSHGSALRQIFASRRTAADIESKLRDLPRAGGRDVALPESSAQLPNVVVIFLESVSYAATSLDGTEETSTPRLEALAAQGVELVSTRAPVSQTNKAFWAALTGSMPDIQSDYAESVLVKEPYESLASRLRRAGYARAFFQMSSGAFGGLPGLLSNLGFDWAWFRENLGDESARLGRLNGDDYRMIDPMFEWVDSRRGPFLLAMINSVSHYPYSLPAWFPRRATTDPLERYLEAVEFTDTFVGEVVDQLARRRLLDNTLLCVLGDHGEGFRPETRRARWVPFEEVIRVPWIMRWPGHLEAGSKIEWPASELDVTPTMLSLLGFGIEAAGFDGKNALAPLPDDRRLYFSAWFRNSPVGFIEGDRKLVYWPYIDRLFEYDLRADPDEKSPRAVEGPDRDRWLAEIQDWERRSRIEVPESRFRERLLFDHWKTYSSGRSAKAFYVP